jgi:hypothetical protein
VPQTRHVSIRACSLPPSPLALSLALSRGPSRAPSRALSPPRSLSLLGPSTGSVCPGHPRVRVRGSILLGYPPRTLSLAAPFVSLSISLPKFSCSSTVICAFFRKWLRVPRPTRKSLSSTLHRCFRTHVLGTLPRLALSLLTLRAGRSRARKFRSKWMHPPGTHFQGA